LTGSVAVFPCWTGWTAHLVPIPPFPGDPLHLNWWPDSGQSTPSHTGGTFHSPQLSLQDHIYYTLYTAQWRIPTFPDTAEKFHCGHPPPLGHSLRSDIGLYPHMVDIGPLIICWLSPFLPVDHSPFPTAIPQDHSGHTFSPTVIHLVGGPDLYTFLHLDIYSILGLL